MRKFSFIFLLAVLPLTLSADDAVSGLVITKTNGERVEVAIAHLRSIKFGSDTMVLYRQSADPISVPLAEVQCLTFDDIVTAIRTVLGPEAEDTLTITDLAGRIAVEIDQKTEGHIAGWQTADGLHVGRSKLDGVAARHGLYVQRSARSIEIDGVDVGRQRVVLHIAMGDADGVLLCCGAEGGHEGKEGEIDIFHGADGFIG